jgi:hypothetical protein
MIKGLPPFSEALQPEWLFDLLFAGCAAESVFGRGAGIVSEAEVAKTVVLFQRHFFLPGLLHIPEVWKIKHSAAP